MGGVTLGLTFGWSGVGGGGVGVGVHGGEDVSLTQLTAAHHNTSNTLQTQIDTNHQRPSSVFTAAATASAASLTPEY